MGYGYPEVELSNFLALQISNAVMQTLNSNNCYWRLQQYKLQQYLNSETSLREDSHINFVMRNLPWTFRERRGLCPVGPVEVVPFGSESYIFKVLVRPIIVRLMLYSNGQTNLALLPLPLSWVFFATKHPFLSTQVFQESLCSLTACSIKFSWDEPSLLLCLYQTPGLSFVTL